MPEVTNVTGIPMEKSMVETKESEIELDAMLDDVPGSFVFNVDEEGCSEWCDASEMKVLVPSSYQGSTIKIPVDRNSKRSTIVACLSGDGKAMRQLIFYQGRY
ncbi:hypothetical protein TRFO_19974 [Tritrichomonas foetus]|uniref:Uncharacterized protein n=1 Tax=Tritrichomonas foetus TaxID=1144522 RepID=A0A1J4KIH0_9EUKA|nr:hypothetical protein TRFO_19974 [Tritrichomonas foetus]|eukprot:OHT10736.1 hypothetical protein TRFO_19974 [Tritrichomonas foetus]